VITVLDTCKHPVYDRIYYLAETEMGRILYYHFSGRTQWKNITNGDVFWSIKPTEEFESIHKSKPIETYAGKRRTIFYGEKIKVNCGDDKYWLAEQKKSDGYLYEIPATLFRVFTKKEYPDMKFPYTRYRIDAVREMDYRTLERMKVEEVMRYNGNDHYSPYVISSICDAVYDYCKKERKTT
jgi:hypothetical protein